MDTRVAKKTKKKLPVKITDMAIILLFIGLTAFSGITVYTRAGGSDPTVIIQGPNNRTWIFPLSAEQTVRVRGILGDDTVVRISGGEVWAESSPCHNQICVSRGRISAASWFPWVACIPNSVFFRVEGSDADTHVDGAVW